ncbi:MAG: sporulation initiation factor Spo0A C-terminal domain-containing protein, partial [Oscillospiraceae bacterium]|nr:sporulation initiation factor Spo0A C-terminal domain-containing protein [Oscillospiraceae bacterium]
TFKRITKDIYPEIALRYGSSSYNVERCIRNCMNVFMQNSKNKMRLDAISGNFGICSNKSKITNSKFLKIIAEAFKLWHMNK